MCQRNSVTIGLHGSEERAVHTQGSAFPSASDSSPRRYREDDYPWTCFSWKQGSPEDNGGCYFKRWACEDVMKPSGLWLWALIKELRRYPNAPLPFYFLRSQSTVTSCHLKVRKQPTPHGRHQGYRLTEPQNSKQQILQIYPLKIIQSSLFCIVTWMDQDMAI